MNQTYQEKTIAPKISIGMPVYNGQKFICEAIDSLIAQSYTDFELIISDNASTDLTEVICREYAASDTRIRYIRQTENRGAVANFQFVLDKADGKYFKWLAADDMFGTTETLANLVKALDEGFELAMPDVIEIDRAKGTSSQKLISVVFSRLKIKNFTELALNVSSHQIYGLFVTASLRRLYFLIDKNSDLACFGEGVFVHAISEKMKCIFIDNALIIYVRHSAAASSSQKPVVLIKNYIKYTIRLFQFYSKSSFLMMEKIRYISILFFKHTRFTLILAVANVQYYWLGTIKRFAQMRFFVK